MHLEPAAVDGLEFVHFVQLVDFGAEFLRQIEIVHGQLVLGVPPAADHAVAAVDAPPALGAFTAEIGVVCLHIGRAEIDADGCAVVGIALPMSLCHLAHQTVDLSVHVRDPHHSEHPRSLINVGCHLVRPVGDPGPFGASKNFFGGNQGLP